MNKKELVVLDEVPMFINSRKKYENPIVFFIFPKDNAPANDGIEKIFNSSQQETDIHTFVDIHKLSESLKTEVMRELKETIGIKNKKKNLPQQLDLFEKENFNA